MLVVIMLLHVLIFGGETRLERGIREASSALSDRSGGSTTVGSESQMESSGTGVVSAWGMTILGARFSGERLEERA